ncbi:MAG TPA: bifunctional methylenetetrahydrofolate dehydrogenase/methenyltetrahydrofolate cyclohydrolase FolD [Burkholderiaceae bacterium]|nr:bifunctional methylenetetrahydrofolate dehydrogenase/methenyltetrahydrofolate cyclohydrolase FolD [Burkholderiaceae bacterium]HPE02580.1 bifunctional methylenetetrahydrofolate dehydrogenase/methenyltetrahydrofolate cyclohydrolase FolD [Burkholderiaceae bacterium]HRZ01356.1 bifunctional methylenetetrahydrofolate dehydrogenase/methenyltetrahydrofolate cyclohydrolase FolD [Burkholderiaceae bacterium]
MSAQIIDGKALAASVRAGLVPRIERLAAAGQRPGLAVLLVGDNPASAVYVRNKVKACEEVGITSILEHLPAATTEDALLARIRELNADAGVRGILVQLPLPPQIDAHRVIETIAPDKDVDGFHVSNAGLLMTGTPHFRPCTPYGVMKMLESIGYALAGKHAVVIGRSNIVGKPMAMLLLAADATVTIAHSRTRDLAAITRQADVLVAAVGRAHMVTADMVKPGAVVIDVGMNKDESGKLCGDVDTAAVAGVAGWITPVPGGVGPMTIAMLLVNTVESAERCAGLPT